MNLCCPHFGVAVATIEPFYVGHRYGHLLHWTDDIGVLRIKIGNSLKKIIGYEKGQLMTVCTGDVKIET